MPPVKNRRQRGDSPPPDPTPSAASGQAGERLQKVLARAGLASRRAAETMILAGRVSVDGQVVRELGQRVDAGRSVIVVDGRRVQRQAFVYVVLNKPRAVMCTMQDPEGRRTVAELVQDLPSRIVPVGRLDYHTSGTLLMTNDGELTQHLLHPSRKQAKVYQAKVRGLVQEANLAAWRRPLEIDGRLTRPARVRICRANATQTWLEITLEEGRNRQIHRLGDASGFPVLVLRRISHAGVTAEGLASGKWRHLTAQELRTVRVGLPGNSPR